MIGGQSLSKRLVNRDFQWSTSAFSKAAPNSTFDEVASPIMLSGSKVLSGEGKMIIIAVGKLSATGKI